MALVGPLKAASNCISSKPDALAVSEWCRLNGPGRWCVPCDAAAYIMCPLDEAEAPKIARCAPAQSWDPTAARCVAEAKRRADACVAGDDVIVPGHNNEVDPPQLPPAPGAAAETGAANLGGGALSAAGDGRGGADDVAGQGASAERELDAAMGSILADMMRNSMASPFSGLMGAGLFGPAPLGGLLGGARAGLTSAAGAVGSQLLSAFAADAAVPRQGARSGVISGGRPLRMSMMLASSGPKTDGSGPSEPEVVMSLEVVGSGLSPEEGSSAKGGAGGDAEAAGALMAEVAALMEVPTGAGGARVGRDAQDNLGSFVPPELAMLDQIARDLAQEYEEDYEERLRAGLDSKSDADGAAAPHRRHAAGLGGRRSRGGALGGLGAILDELVGGDKEEILGDGAAGDLGGSRNAAPETKPVALTGNSTQDSDALAGAILERLSVLARAAALETLETVDAGGARPSLSVHDLAQELSSRPAPPQAPAGAAAAQAARQRISDAIAPLLKRQTPAGARALARALVPSAIDADLSEAAPVLVLSPKLSGMLAGSGVEAAMKAALEELSYNDVLSADLGDDASVGSACCPSKATLHIG
ncbi:hypothetical protein MNEG_5200 [Monoraphidium neglectum]|uniref:Uncharacterized protein n=1 Tax=Monoraphidium neglectum TaxID=145388 RepID=A0A0D2MIA4_9CHLO|nr:hypothetical protein MNEG_5200 [Monoraphidium neglectum]KIZ02760.1 hypothetical protein MNEG_5200 [Monoraphidium neglectum]|eukprot:XP_013901779.1 hypothetical protein MNEG_5200 [Monoraphidium neglectum]